MRTSLRFIASAALLAMAPRASEASTPLFSKTIQAEDCRIEYRVYSNSEPGRIFLDPYRIEKKHGIAHLLVLDTDGTLVFHRPFEHFFRPMVLGDFKEVEPGYFGYFLSTKVGDAWTAKYYFLDSGFHDVFLHPVPNYDPRFDAHWAIHVPNGNYFFLFSRKRRKGASSGISDEIQELDLRQNAPFTWNAEDYLSLPRDRQGSLEISSFNWDSGGLLLALPTTQEVVKMAYPLGNSLWRLSSRDWKFVGDEKNGFQAPYSVVRLANEDILMIDSRGNGEAARAVEYRIDPEKKTATLVWQFVSSSHASVGRNASVQRLRNGNTLIAWGAPEAVVSEITPKGEVAREWRFSNGYTVPSAYFQEKN